MADKGMLTTRARAMRKQASRAERALWELLRDRQLGVKFRRQFPIGRYIADFASVEAKLVVEVDGNSHDVADQAAYDVERDATLNTLGWRILRVHDTPVLSEPHRVADLIRNALR